MERRGYHHGNLREALLAAALRLIGEKGASGFTVAEAARAAGVSPAAPYRHFRDRDQLLAGVARQGFERLAEGLQAAWDDGRPDPVTALERLGAAYLGFARAEPASYAAMFEAGLAQDDHPELAQAADRAFGLFRTAAEAVTRRLDGDRRPPATMLALHVWTLAHGTAALFSRGDAARRRLPMAPEDLLEAGLLIYLDGLGLRPAAKITSPRS